MVAFSEVPYKQKSTQIAEFFHQLVGHTVISKPILFQCLWFLSQKHWCFQCQYLHSPSCILPGLLLFPFSNAFMCIHFFCFHIIYWVLFIQAVLQMQILGNDISWHLKVYFPLAIKYPLNLGGGKSKYSYIFSCLHQFVQSTDSKVIYTCICQDKRFLFLKHGADGKTCYFLHFMDYMPVTRCLPHPLHNSA